MAVPNLTAKEFGRRFRKALSVPFLMDQVCTTHVKEFISSYAATLGCTEKCLLFPLLTCTAACLGTNSHLELTEEWLEPPIIWTLVVTPISLSRISVAEHLKQLLLEVQNEIWEVKKEDSKEHLKKFIFDSFNLDQFQDMLKLSSGHGLGIYNSVRILHKNMATPYDAEVMLRLHSGFSWFSDSRVKKCTLTKTRVNFTVISTPSTVHQTLTSAPNFQELFQQCFLTACTEETHVKFGQLSVSSQKVKLKQIFKCLMELHFTGVPLVYKFSPDAKEKFEQIHDELTDKAKQMVRKNAHKVFVPALSYLGRLSWILHVLDNVIEALTWTSSLERGSWNVEINAATVWQARELLGHMIEQRYALMEQTNIDVSQQKSRPQAIDLDDCQSSSTPSFHLTPQFRNNQNTRMANAAPIRTQGTYQRSVSNAVNTARRNINNVTQAQSSDTFDSLLNQQRVTKSNDPRIVCVSSAGLRVPNNNTINPVVAGHDTNSLNTRLNLPSSLSVSVNNNSSQPPLLSRGSVINDLVMSETDFIHTYALSIKKVLINGVSVSPSRCVEQKIIQDPKGSGEQQYSTSFARSFLKKLSVLGFGICEGPKHNNNMRHFLFKKYKFNVLGEKQKQILDNLRIRERDYSKCFQMITNNVQNGVVCLE